MKVSFKHNTWNPFISVAKVKLFLHERLRFGCYMSHVMLWETVVKEKTELVVILEDDVFVTADFSENRILQLQTAVAMDHCNYRLL